jgi:hypothetical protein
MNTKSDAIALQKSKIKTPPTRGWSFVSGQWLVVSPALREGFPPQVTGEPGGSVGKIRKNHPQGDGVLDRIEKQLTTDNRQLTREAQ